MSNLKSKKVELIKRANEIVANAKNEVRELTPEEQKEFDSIVEEVQKLSKTIKQIDEALSKTLSNLEEPTEAPTEAPTEVPTEAPTEAPTEEPNGNVSVEKRYKKNSNNKGKNMQSNQNTITKLIRSAMSNGTRSFTINAVKRDSMSGGDYPALAENTIPELLEPLYANSILADLNVRWYKGLPMGNLTVPYMSESNVGWASEVGAASKTEHEFYPTVFKPKRLTAYIDISKQLINQDTYGLEDVIRRDIINGLRNKLEETIFGSEAGSDTQPAGLFYNLHPEANKITNFKELCEFEAELESENLHGPMKYILSPSAKAALRSMAKSTKNTQLVYEGGEVDGVPAFTTANITGSTFAYGNFEYLAVASWGDIDVTVDEYSQAVNGCVRLVINAYFDFQMFPGEFIHAGTIADA